MRCSAFAIALALLSAGCTTTLKTDHVAANQQASIGVLYNLPMASFDAEAKFLVTNCVVSGAGNARLSYDLVDGTVSHYLTPDPLETYRIRYDMLNAPTKVTAVAVTLHPNGMVRSINAEADDRTAQVLASAASTAINLFKAATLAGVGVVALGAAQRCDDFVAKPLEDRLALLGKMAQARADDKVLADDQDKLDEVATLLDAAKTKLADATKAKDEAAIAKAQAEVKALQAQWNVANSKVSGKKRQVPELDEKLASLTKALTVSAKRIGWAPRVGAAECEEISTGQKEFLEQFAASKQVVVTKPANPVDKFQAKLCASVPTNARKAQEAKDKNADQADISHLGVVYRLPALGFVRIEHEGRKFFAQAPVSMPQFGAKGLVWLKNEPFDNNSVKASFNEDGSMSELSFKAAAQAERAAAAASDTSKSLVELFQLRSDAIKAKAQAREDDEKKAQQKQLDNLDAQISLLTKRKELEGARMPTKDVLDKEKELLQKQIDVETLRQQYDALKKKAEKP